MSEYRPSPAKLSVMVVFGLGLFGAPAVFGTDLSTAARIFLGLCAVACLVVVVPVARTRIIVGDDEIAVRRGFSQWFRAAPDDVRVTWVPILSGLGSGHAWELKVGRKSRPKDGISVPLNLWPAATVEALRERLSQVTGATTN